MNPEQVQLLRQQGFSTGKKHYSPRKHPHTSCTGLIHAFAQNAVAFRWWIVDNSSSMAQRDAQIVSGSIHNITMVGGTRWDEVKDCVLFHGHLAAMFRLPSRYTVCTSVLFIFMSHTQSLDAQ